jgi:hypothetical protein
MLLSDSIIVSESFEDSAYSDFSVIPYPVNFTSTENALKEISEWISNTTGHSSEKLFKEGIRNIYKYRILQ